ncbi:MAG TPA: HypC/HybG/HupF family hydrogenase formation chaperone [Chthoniobacterales bacterium]|nr:HypC/HybG/HupF family hydrogenase formation chaperone [Chthoniobacterales bacterium]
MNLLYGQIVEIASEDGMRVGKIRVAGAFKNVSLELLGEAQIGDRVLVCDGIAISKEEPRYARASLHHSNTPSHHHPPAGFQGSNEAPNESGPRTF